MRVCYICVSVYIFMSACARLIIQSLIPLYVRTYLHPYRDPNTKKKTESARVLRLQQLRRTLTGKYSENTFCTMENLDEAVVNKVRNILL
jgi:hypothetical protein